MLTLIMREIEDNRVFFIGALILAFIFSVLFLWWIYYGVFDDVLFGGLPIWNAILGMLIFCGFGAAQMYFDKGKKISALLATLAVNRGQIFAARVITGFLLVLIGLVPLVAVTITAVLTKSIEPAHSVRLLYPEVSIPVFLLGFACYCIGLQAGWTSNRLIPTLGALGLSFVFMSVILIKGFGWEIYVILVFLITACLVRAWHRFSTAAF
jgi:hypothetical protein